MRLSSTRHALVGVAAIMLFLFMGSSFAADTLSVSNSSGLPGQGGYTFSVNISNTDTLKGILFTLVDVPDSLSVTNLALTARATGFRVESKTENGAVKILIVPASATKNARILPGTGALLDVTVDVDADAEGGTKATLSLTGIALADSNNNAVAAAAVNGHFWFGQKGDVIFNGAVDLFDVLRMIDIAIGRPPAATEYESWAGDFDGNGAVDILDIGQAIDLAVTSPTSSPDPGEQEQTVGTARFDMLRMPARHVGAASIPVTIKNSVPVSGVQMVFKFDSDKLKVSAPSLTEQAANMQVKSRVKDNKLYVMLYSVDGKTIAPGESMIMTLPVQVLSPAENNDVIELEQVAAGTEGAARVQALFGNKVEEAVVPESFALFQNNPNPFNMSTIITYDVPQLRNGTTRVKIQIYNTQGQLVRTLEDRDRTTGRYTVQWDGTDDLGRFVSSGVYFYKLIANNVVLSKKLAVMK